jgi:2-polyprenyl-3-methyl-5-hydroxy-6-metoxy-1,4-benzoquinol methylase
MNNLRVRERTEEQMDAPGLPPAVYDRVLADLSRVNRWTFTARPTLAYLARALDGRRAFSLLDIGFGQGDMLRAIAKWAAQRGIAARLVGVDLNPKSKVSARAATSSDLRIDYRTGDYRGQPEQFDLMISSQVAHHMTDAELGCFIAFMENTARCGWLISDLHRHRFSHWGFPILARALRVHRIVREDGQLSIARSFRPGEWPKICADAGVDPALVHVARRFPFRLCVERIRPASVEPV